MIVNNFIPRKFIGEDEDFNVFIHNYNISIILGETGSGKTYQLKHYYETHKETSKYLNLNAALNNNYTIDKNIEVLLLDSIDETIHIRNNDNKIVEDELKKYILNYRKINENIKFVIACRYSEWKREYEDELRKIDSDYQKLQKDIENLDRGYKRMLKSPAFILNPRKSDQDSNFLKKYRDKSVHIYEFEKFTEESINKILSDRKVNKKDFWNFIKKNKLSIQQNGHDTLRIKNIQVILFTIDKFINNKEKEIKNDNIYEKIVKCHLTIRTDNERTEKLDNLLPNEMFDIVSMLAFFLIRKGRIKYKQEIKKISNDISNYFDEKITDEKLKIIFDTALFYGKSENIFFDDHNHKGSYASIYLSAYYLNKFNIEKIKELTTHKLGIISGCEETLSCLITMKPELVEEFIDIDPFIFNKNHKLKKNQQEKLLKSILNKLQNGDSNTSRNNSKLVKFDKVDNIEEILNDHIDIKKINKKMYSYILHISPPLSYFSKLWNRSIKEKNDIIKIVKKHPTGNDEYNINFFEFIKNNNLLDKNTYITKIDKNNQDTKRPTFDYNLFNVLYKHNLYFNELVPLLDYITYKELKGISTTLTKNELIFWFSYMEKTYSNKKYSPKYIYHLIYGLLNKYENKEILESIIFFLQKNNIKSDHIPKANNLSSLDKIITDIWSIYFSISPKNISNINFLLTLFQFNQEEIEKLPHEYPIEKNIEKYKNLRSSIHYLDWSFSLKNKTFVDKKNNKISNTQINKIEENSKISIDKIKEKFKENKIDISGITKIRDRYCGDIYWIDYSCSVSTPFIELFRTHSTEEVVKILDNEESYTKLFWLWLIAIQNNPYFYFNVTTNYFNVLSNKYSDLFMSLITEYFDFFMEHTKNKHISNNLETIKSHINYLDKKSSLVEHTKKIPKNAFKYLDKIDKFYLLQLIASEKNNFKHIQSIIRHDEANIVDYLKILFSIDTNETMNFFMEFYNERGKDVNLYTGFIDSFIDHNSIGSNLIDDDKISSKLDKIEQKYIKELIVDFYNEFNESEDLVFDQSINLESMDTGLWWYLKDEKILEELTESENKKIALSAERRLKPIYDEKAKNREKILKAISEGTKPLIITEGKTDWMHMEKALKRLKKEENLYLDLDIDFLRYTHPKDDKNKNMVGLNMGYDKLDQNYDFLVSMSNKRKTIDML